MTERALAADAVLSAYDSAIRLNGISASTLPADHGSALSMLANMLDMSLGVMRHLARQLDLDDEALLMMMKTWVEMRLSEQLNVLYEESG